MERRPLKTEEISAREDSRPSSQTAKATLALREMLVQGQFRPGERIREVPLAARLNVSRIGNRFGWHESRVVGHAGDDSESQFGTAAQDYYHPGPDCGGRGHNPRKRRAGTIFSRGTHFSGGVA